MTSPFSSETTPLIIDLLSRPTSGNADINPGSLTITSSAIASIYGAVGINFDLISGNLYFAMTYGHDSLTNAGTTNIHLRDYTGSVTIATATTQTTSATMPATSRFTTSTDTMFVLATKPSGTTLVGMRILNGDNVSRDFAIYNAQIWVI